MIQELFGGSNVGIIGGERNKFDSSPSHDSSSPAAAAASATSENLRCPRCDSSNTKFCYYNNYNLTQPRHFCKTCRRYWTKGGALRNVPIGGGCRKNKNTTITAKSTSPGSKLIKTASFEAHSSNPIIWASSQNSSHFLSLLNPNPIKEEYSPASLFIPPHVSSDSPIRALGLDHFNPAHLPVPNPVYRNQTLTSSGQGIMYSDQNAGLQEAFNQRLRSSANCYPDHAPLILGNTASAILESSPVAAGDHLGFWNIPTLSWNTDSAYP